MQSIRELSNLVSPPDHLIDKPSKAVWSKFEKEMQLKVPEDIKQLLETYGSGRFSDFLHLLVPDANNKYLCMKYKNDEFSTYYNNCQELAGEEDPLSPYAVHPQQAGLVLWGVTDNGNFLFWYPQGNSYKTVLTDWRLHLWEDYETNATDFLLQLFSGKLVSDVFPDDFPIIGEVNFEPSTTSK